MPAKVAFAPMGARDRASAGVRQRVGARVRAPAFRGLVGPEWAAERWGVVAAPAL
jgi:hypothetical protein